jgi:hypothetical protein
VPHFLINCPEDLRDEDGLLHLHGIYFLEGSGAVDVGGSEDDCYLYLEADDKEQALKHTQTVVRDLGLGDPSDLTFERELG